MKIFSISGWSGSGKTTLITRLIESFRSRGLRVVAVKKTPDGYDLQPEAKDSRLFLEAGADEVYLFSPSEIVRMIPRRKVADAIAWLRSQLQPQDIALLEGLTGEGIPIIEVFKAEGHERTKFPLGELAALVSDKDPGGELPHFAAHDLEGIARFIEEYHGQASHSPDQR